MGGHACDHARHATPSSGAVREALARAQARCESRGERWTEPRRRVFELLLGADAPVKAYDLMEAFDAERAAKPPTVYRALEFLERQGLAHRIASLNAYTACEEGGAAGGAHAASFLICDCCGAAEEFEPVVQAEIARASRERGFRPDVAMLEVRGLCRACTS